MTKKSNRPRVAIAVPIERNINQQAFFSFVEIARQGWEFLHLPYTRNDIARNKFAEAAVRGGFDYLLQLDSDHKHPPDIIQRLLRWPLNNPEVRVVGGLNFRRGAPYDPCAFVIGDDGQKHYTLVDWEQGIIEVDAIGSGSLLVHTSVFEELPFTKSNPWFGYSYDAVEDVDNGWPGVDMWFCRRLREVGIKMYVDTTTSSPHLIDSYVTEQTYRSYLQANQERIAESVGYSQVKEVDGANVWSIGDRCIEKIKELIEPGAAVFELGSGEGTAKLSEAGYGMVSVEHDSEYVNKQPSSYIYAPIVQNGSHPWYDAEIVAERKPSKYDLLLIDGPPGHVGRLGMLDHLDLFDLSVPIVVDDVNRNAERYLLEQLAKHAGRPFTIEYEADGSKAFGVI